MSEPKRGRRVRGLAPYWFVAPLVVAAFVSYGRSWTPIGDLELVDLKLRHLLSHPPLVGPYSRFGWSHPGPAMYWILWLPWRIVGGGPRGLLFSTLLWHAGASTVSLWLARRCGGIRLMIVSAVVLVATTVVNQPDALVQPWNPYLNFTLVPGLMCAVVLAARIDRVGWVWFAVIGSVMAQNHLGLLPPVLTLVGVVAACTLVRWWRSDDRSARWRGDGVTLALVGGTGVVLWLLPIVEQILHAPGNLSLLWRFASGSEARLGIAGAARIIGRQLGLTPPWLGFRTPLDQFVGGIDVSLGGWRTWPVLLVLPILALMRAARSRRWPDLEIVALFTMTILVGFASVVGVSGPAHEYLVAWVSLACAMLVGFSLVTLVLPVLGQRASVGGRSLRAARLVLAFAGGSLAVSTVIAPNPYLHLAPAARELDEQLARRYDSAAPTLNFVEVTDFDALSVLSALVDTAERRGWTVHVPSEYAKVGFDGKWTEVDRDPRHEQLTLASGIAARRLLEDPTLERIAYYQPFSEGTRRRIWELSRSLEQLRGIESPSEEEVLGGFYKSVELARLQNAKADVSIFRRR